MKRAIQLHIFSVASIISACCVTMALNASPATEAPTSVKGFFGESLADDIYLNAGRKLVPYKIDPNLHGPDRIYRLANGNLEIHEVKAYTNWPGQAAMQTTSGGKVTYELSKRWCEDWINKTLNSATASKSERIAAQSLANAMKRGRVEFVFDEFNLTTQQFRASNVIQKGSDEVIPTLRIGPVKLKRFNQYFSKKSKDFLRMKSGDLDNSFSSPKTNRSWHPISKSDRLIFFTENAGNISVKSSIFTDRKIHPRLQHDIYVKHKTGIFSGSVCKTQKYSVSLKDANSKNVSVKANWSKNRSVNIKKGASFAKGSGMILSATVVAGFIIARDAARNGITSETFIKAGVASATTIATGIAIDYSINFLVKQSSQIAANYFLNRMGKRITKRAVDELAKKLAPTIGKTLGGCLQIAFGVYFIGDEIYDYYKGNITQTDMLVNVSIVALTTAGTVFFTCTEAGAAIGTSICPGLGTAAGATIGFVIGVAGGVATGGYMWYVESKRQENLLREARQLAEWETKNNRERLERTIQELEQKSEQMRNDAWRCLLPAS